MQIADTVLVFKFIVLKTNEYPSWSFGIGFGALRAAFPSLASGRVVSRLSATPQLERTSIQIIKLCV